MTLSPSPIDENPATSHTSGPTPRRTPVVPLALIVGAWGSLAMGWVSPAVFCWSVIAFMMAALISNRFAPELAVTGALVVLLIGSHIVPADQQFLPWASAWSGFANKALVAVAALFIVAQAIRRAGILDKLAHKALGDNGGQRRPLARIAFPLMGLSAFLNNTPIVAIFMPMLRQWGLNKGISPAKLLLPMAYFTGFGGMCTIIGTSTTLVVDGMAQDLGASPIGFFDLAWVGLPCGLIGVVYLLTLGHRLLPERKDLLETTTSQMAQGLVQARIAPGSPLIGKSILDAGLRDIPDLFLFKVENAQDIHAPVKGHYHLQAQDMLTFSGQITSAPLLQRFEGLKQTEAPQELKIGSEAQLLEVVIAPTSTLVGKTLDEVWFNRTYDAAVLALHRDAKPIVSELSSTPLKTGDTLLLLAGIGFRRIWQERNEFLMVTPLREDLARTQRAPLCAIIVLGMLAMTVFAGVPIAYSALMAALTLVLTGCIDQDRVLGAIDWRVLMTIGSAFGISSALTASGAANGFVSALNMIAAEGSPLVALAIIYIATNILTEILTNNAAAALMVPITLGAANAFGVSAQPFVIAVAIAASASFATPIGYQTNLLVFGPGGYRYSDYLKVGTPLNLIFLVGTLVIVPTVWPFS